MIGSEESLALSLTFDGVPLRHSICRSQDRHAVPCVPLLLLSDFGIAICNAAACRFQEAQSSVLHTLFRGSNTSRIAWGESIEARPRTCKAGLGLQGPRCSRQDDHPSLSENPGRLAGFEHTEQL